MMERVTGRQPADFGTGPYAVPVEITPSERKKHTHKATPNASSRAERARSARPSGAGRRCWRENGADPSCRSAREREEREKGKSGPINAAERSGKRRRKNPTLARLCTLSFIFVRPLPWRKGDERVDSRVLRRLRTAGRSRFYTPVCMHCAFEMQTGSRVGPPPSVQGGFIRFRGGLGALHSKRVPQF